MKNKPRYLTKSRFKLASECPTKLDYTNNKSYANQKLDDAFLEALAEGGFQVGELAKCYYPQGYDISSLDYQESEAQTLELLKKDKVVIFEPAIRFNNLFIRIDVLVKTHNHFQLIEVKAKSYSAREDKDFMNTKGKLASGWKPYLYDVAFQQYVLKNAFPNSTIDCYLMLVDKSAVAIKDGLNQKFKIVTDNEGRKGIDIVELPSQEELAQNNLIKVNVNRNLDYIFDNEHIDNAPGDTFEQNILALAKHYESDIRIAPVIGTKCKKCEFKCGPEQTDKKDGFKQCWQEQLRWQENDFDNATVLDIWNFRKAKSLIEAGKIKVKDLSLDDVGIKESSQAALTNSERQWLQIEKIQQDDDSIYFDSDSVKREMESWNYPLHFIDFETSTVALPFHKGMRPYEVIAFQFSHHTVDEKGIVTHANEFLETTPGKFPNFEFIRALKSALENNNGTIFRYSSHENTVLNQIREQLLTSDESDKDELCGFIKLITQSTQNSKTSWVGERNMVDLCELVKKYYYDPHTGGSNSIKYVLPAIINRSDKVKAKYSEPVYGGEIRSLNFQHHTWITLDKEGKALDPYKTLPKMFTDNEEKQITLLSDSDELNNGGLALTAYAKSQFTEMSDYERQELNAALLKYCELDTLAMVMIYEAWLDWCS